MLVDEPLERFVMRRMLGVLFLGVLISIATGGDAIYLCRVIDVDVLAGGEGHHCVMSLTARLGWCARHSRQGQRMAG